METFCQVGTDHRNSAPGPGELQSCGRTVMLPFICQDSLSKFYPWFTDQGDCEETAWKLLTLVSAWKIIRVYTGTLQFSAFGFAVHVKTSPIRGEHLELFARKAPTKEFLSLQCLAALWQVKSSPLLLPVPEQPQAGDSAVCKMGRFFRQPELFAGSSEYPDPCQGHRLLLVLLQSLQSWVLIDYCLQSRKRRDCNCQTELINLKAQVDESMLHIITLS